MTEAGRAGILNTAAADIPGAPWKPHPHGFSEVLYAFSSAAGNNGSAFAGLTAYSTDHPVFYSLTLAINMLFGRFLPIVAVLAIAGNMAKKKRVPPGPSSFPVAGGLFIALLTGTILLVGALTFFPMLSFGPIVEHFQLAAAAAAH
jgi:K+-transporting ATPase ATPase A chain